MTDPHDPPGGAVIDDNWLDSEDALDWVDARAAHDRCRVILRRLAADRAYLSRLITGVGGDDALFDDSDHHPVMDRLTLYRDDARGLYLRLHLSPGRNELIPHDHKYAFTTYILRGSYVHVWRRRGPGHVAGPFTSRDVAPGTITIEREGSCYTLFESLVHQTAMESGTVTLFMRGPERFDRSHAASDMLHLLGTDELTPPGASVRVVAQRHTDGQRALRRDEYDRLVEQLRGDGVIDAVA